MVSNRLSGVVFSPFCNGDTTAPALQTRIDDDTRKEKETTIFNRAMNEIHDQHWNKIKFDGFEVNVEVVPCNNNELIFDDYEKVIRSVSNLHSENCINFRTPYEIIFTKCKDTCCGAFRSETIKRLFNGIIKFPSPSESQAMKGHYNTFLQ